MSTDSHAAVRLIRKGDYRDSAVHAQLVAELQSRLSRSCCVYAVEGESARMAIGILLQVSSREWSCKRDWRNLAADVQLSAELQRWPSERRFVCRCGICTASETIVEADRWSCLQIRSRSRKSRARMVVRVGFGLQEWQFAGLSVCWSAARCAGVAVWRLIHVPWEDSACKRDR